MQKMLARQSVSLDLPNFSGEEDEWAGFYCEFTESTKLCGLSNQRNRARLQKCLRGKALDAVRPVLFLPENVPKVTHRHFENVVRPASTSDQVHDTETSKIAQSVAIKT